MRTKMKMEKDLAKVKNIMEGLSKEGARLQEVISTLRKGAPGAGLGPGKTVSTAQSSKYTSVPFIALCLGSVGMDCVISELCYILQFYTGIIGK